MKQNYYYDPLEDVVMDAQRQDNEPKMIPNAVADVFVIVIIGWAVLTIYLINFYIQHQ